MGDNGALNQKNLLVLFLFFLLLQEQSWIRFELLQLLRQFKYLFVLLLEQFVFESHFLLEFRYFALQVSHLVRIYSLLYLGLLEHILAFGLELLLLQCFLLD